MKSKKPAAIPPPSLPNGPGGETNRYKVLIEKIFFDHWSKGKTEFEFVRDEIKQKAQELDVALPDNVGDVPYSFRYRISLPQSIIETQPKGLEWIIEGAGIKGGAKIDHETPAEWRFVAVQKVTTTLQFH